MPQLTPDELAEQILAKGYAGRRRLVALAGPPASGKSTLAEALVEALGRAGSPAQVVPMDGFHLHNQILIDRGLLDRKGAPETFDVQGFVQLVARLRDEAEVFFPTFDRARDIVISAAGHVVESTETAIVEGNYLLYDAPIWRDLHGLWDVSVQLQVPEDDLRERLVARWLTHGLSRAQAEARAAENDLRNARLVMAASLPADIAL